MPTYTPEELRVHIETKLSFTLKERAERIYGDMTFDYALPKRWLCHFAETVGVEKWKASKQFVWIYPEGSIAGEPGPLSVEACSMLETYYEQTKNPQEA